jgi:large subunit ribosomal protein L22
MEITATAKSVRVSPRKVRLVADGIRNVSAKKALQILTLVEKRGAYPLAKVLKSAIANAVNNAKMMEENLTIYRLEVTEGPALKRFHASTRGRIHPYKKKSSHIRITLKEKGDKKA